MPLAKSGTKATSNHTVASISADRGEPEMTCDHERLPLAEGHGSRASATPKTTTNKTIPKMNCKGVLTFCMTDN
jgi:hypothetical protein